MFVPLELFCVPVVCVADAELCLGGGGAGGAVRFSGVAALLVKSPETLSSLAAGIESEVCFISFFFLGS